MHAFHRLHGQLGYSPEVGPRPESLSLNGGGRDGTSGDFKVEQTNGGGRGGGIGGQRL